ncbi:AbrB/MazE/SpoVT family DNA-binding domain-containing protein [Macrococcus armenti]|uniref:AbrB/MazE/SpoVT family DNA-binding domain-containing protein n=1 Tax=Macrococcus armenti TaxID=2875764 RepID=A0ABY3ZVC6_9STAP|nr:AbrB/MazE/SpoVT family DNA-binding domain-containing protein [Macrococcus armenti]UOB20788.1 AbrB/MazE/SpoVT family DNA-binding domain-containing protein [Macrococcus armenti]
MMYEETKSKHSIIKEQKLWKTGNSTVVTVPKEMMESLNAGIGDTLEFDVMTDCVVIKKKETTDQDILDLAKEISQEYHSTFEKLVER